MTQLTTRILPDYNSAERPAWLVHGAHEAWRAALPTNESIAWSEFAVRACDEMATAADGLPGFPGPGSDPPDDGLQVAMAAALLGDIATRSVSPYDSSELCRRAYPRCWDSALDEFAHSPHATAELDPALFDHSVALRSFSNPDVRWPAGMHEAHQAVMELANEVSASRSLGLCLAHVVPGPVAWPPPDAGPALEEARHDLDDALAGTQVSQREHTSMLLSCLSARDNPDVPDPSPAEIDQVQASMRDWNASVVPAAVRLATATFAHAYEWASTDTERWDPPVVAYAHAEAYVSIYHLRQVTDSYDLTNGAVCSYAWWWCQDRRLDLASLRKLASTW
ncbi:hypothetical protein [Candidatus Poriferisodalis sp.]|uniref:hypothetical protein n=1 Tax=Candidatus Poriferisodalis sp. TaxID=3101277 RepID=UPI003B02EA39